MRGEKKMMLFHHSGGGAILTVNAYFHKDKNATGGLWELWSYNLSVYCGDVVHHAALGTDLWTRRGVVPGHEGRGILGRLPELGVDWTSPTSHSCPACEGPAAFAVAKGKKKDRQRKLAQYVTALNISNKTARGIHHEWDQETTAASTNSSVSHSLAWCLQQINV